MLDALQSSFELVDFSALASELFGRPIGALAASILLLGTVATGCGILAGLYYARKRYIVAHRELAIKEEALSTQLPKAKIFLFGEEGVDLIVYMIPLDGKTLFSLPLNIGTKNDSSVEFKNILVLMKLNADVYGHEFMIRQPEPMAQAFGFERYEQGEDGTKLVVALTKITRVPPGTAPEMEDFLLTSSSTVFEEVVEAESRDGVQLRIPFKLEASLQIQINVQGENVAPSNKNVSVHFLKRPEGSIKEYFKSRYGNSFSPGKHGKTVIVWFDGREENKEYAEMMKDLERDLKLYTRNKKAGLRKFREKYGTEITDAELMEVVEGKRGNTRKSLVALKNRTVAVMNRRYP